MRHPLSRRGSPRRRTAGNTTDHGAAKKALITRRRRAAGRKAALTRKRRNAGNKAALKRKHRKAGHRAAATKRRAAAAPAIERHFHDVIRARVAEGKLRAPDPLPPLDGRSKKRGWFPVPGVYGGFAYEWDLSAEEPTLVTESWCRVVDGSGQRHVITQRGARLVEEGFV